MASVKSQTQCAVESNFRLKEAGLPGPRPGPGPRLGSGHFYCIAGYMGVVTKPPLAAYLCCAVMSISVLPVCFDSPHLTPFLGSLSALVADTSARIMFVSILVLS